MAARTHRTSRRILGTLALGVACAGGLFASVAGAPQTHAASLGNVRIQPDPSGPTWHCALGSCVPHASASVGYTRLQLNAHKTLIVIHGGAYIIPDPNTPPWRQTTIDAAHGRAIPTRITYPPGPPT